MKNQLVRRLIPTLLLSVLISSAFVAAPMLLKPASAEELAPTVRTSPVTWASMRAQSKTKWPECFCTDRYGKRHELGDIICLTVGGRSYEAKCIMAQNNPFWRDLKRGCMSSHLSPNATPFAADPERFAG
ncbi:MAG: hypothetical protein AAFO73_09420 [Pseudomonadota bacterium]